MTEPLTDAHAGKCMNCRMGTHGLCASPSCTCTTGRHSALRSPIRKDPPMPSPLRSVEDKPKALRLLTREDPPPDLPPAAAELFEAVRDCPPDGQWYRVGVVHKNRAAAARAVNGLKGTPDVGALEFLVTKTGLVYVRLVVEPF